MARRHGLKVVDQFAFGRDYRRTLKLWRGAFLARLDAVREQRFDERFIRLWDFYLCYCEAAFSAQTPTSSSSRWNTPETDHSPDASPSSVRSTIERHARRSTSRSRR